MKGIQIAVCVLAVAATLPSAEAGDGSSDAYVLALGDTTHASNIDVDQLVRIPKGRTGDFLWFRQGRRAHLVTDAGVLATARDIVRPLWELGREQQVISDRLSPFEERERALDRDQERLEKRLERLGDREDHATSEERRRLETLQRELEAKLRAVEADMRAIEADERRLDERERDLDREADGRFAELIADALRRGLARPLP